MKITIEEIKKNKVLALSWKEPYGSLMLHGKIETRRWPTKYRGLVLICCSKKSYDYFTVQSISGTINFTRIREKLGVIPMVSYGSTEGKAIAIGRLVFCRAMQSSDEEQTFVKHWSDLYCHIYEDVTPIVPFPWKGKQGWSAVPDEIKKIIILK